MKAIIEKPIITQREPKQQSHGNYLWAEENVDSDVMKPCLRNYNKRPQNGSSLFFSKIEECNDSPPKKLMKIDNKFHKPDISMDSGSLMEFKENCQYDDDDGCCIVAEIPKKSWGTLPTMARKSIRKSWYKSSRPIDLTKAETDDSGPVEITNKTYESNKDIQVVEYVANNNLKKSAPEEKKKNGTDRIFKTFRTIPQHSNDPVKSRETSFQVNMRQQLNFLRESYRLAEKYQYNQLLQSQTSRTPSLYSSIAQKQISQKISKGSIPLVDLTKDKTSVIINRSREDVPSTARLKNRDDQADQSSSCGKHEIPRINSFQEYLKTNPVTEEDIVEQILSRHMKASAEKRKQVALETVKLEALSGNNRKAYGEVLEERLRRYMKITTPVIVEDDLESEEKYKLPSLSQEQETQISRALVPSPPGQILAEKFGLQIKRRDMQTLNGLNWLNDEVINFYMNLIMERCKDGKLPKVYAFNTFFYPKLISTGHASLKRWTKKVDIFSFDMVLVPVHLKMHWCMSVIDFRSKEVRYYDSMGSANNECLQALLTYLEDESLDKRKTTYSTADWKTKNMENIPQQMNGSDCGVFSCMFAEHLSRDSPVLFTQDNMPYFRRKMVLEILEGRLLT